MYQDSDRHPDVIPICHCVLIWQDPARHKLAESSVCQADPDPRWEEYCKMPGIESRTLNNALFYTMLWSSEYSPEFCTHLSPTINDGVLSNWYQFIDNKLLSIMTGRIFVLVTDFLFIRTNWFSICSNGADFLMIYYAPGQGRGKCQRLKCAGQCSVKCLHIMKAVDHFIF